MRAEVQNTIADIQKSLELLRQRMDWDMAPHRLEEFNARVEDPTLWNDPEKAQALMRDRQNLVDAIGTVTGIAQELQDNIDLIELGEMEEDTEVVKEAEAALKALKAKAAEKELEALLDGEADGNDAFLEINAGAGGTESCDWASILARMYVRWAERKGYKVEMQAQSPGEEAGIKSVVYKVSGHNAYGWMKSESGVHRLVRISPYDSAARRHTSFSSVWVYPVVDDNIEIDVAPNDIRIDTYRSSGAGGQHVNTTDSAVRITHLPTGLVVTSSEKSQHQNRANAMAVLRARLYEMERDRLHSERAADRKSQVGSGDRSERIRTYNFPQGRMTDHRINLTLYALPQIMGGDLDEVIDALVAHDQAERLAEMEG
jgi:peptide chain release factor 2